MIECVEANTARGGVVILVGAGKVIEGTKIETDGADAVIFGVGVGEMSSRD